MKNIFLILFFSIPVFISAQSGGQIKGKVTDGSICNSESCNGLTGVRIKIYSSLMHDTLYTSTDSIGQFSIKPLSGGVYIVVAEKQGFTSVIYKGVIVSEGKTTYLQNPSIKIYPIGYQEPKPEKIVRKKKHKKKHY